MLKNDETGPIKVNKQNWSSALNSFLSILNSVFWGLKKKKVKYKYPANNDTDLFHADILSWYNCTGWLGVKHQLTYHADI